jgi:nitrate/nitrite transporter NarK
MHASVWSTRTTDLADRCAGMSAHIGRGHRIVDWNPEDTAAWEAGNKIARRNLLCTMAGDHVAFSIWSLWSVMALFMPASVYGFSAGDKLLIGAVATLVGGCGRIPYTLGIAAFGGRNWTTLSAFVLLIPTVGTIVLPANPGLPLCPYVACAALTSWIGFAFAFGQVLQVNFLACGETARHASLHAAQIAFVGSSPGWETARCSS